MNFTAYLDESGTTNSPAIAVAGYLSTPERWVQFEAEWLEALRDFGIEKDGFHMVDFAHSRKQFSGWTEEQRRLRFARLAAIINRNVIGSVAISFSHADYRGTFNTRADKHVGGPYGLAATICWISLSDIFRLTGALGWIAYVYEAGAAGAGQVHKTFMENLNNPSQQQRERLLSITFQPKRTFVPLQAADILAYEWAHWLPRFRADSRKQARQTLRLLVGPPGDWSQVDSQQLRMWSRVITTRTMLKPSELVQPSPAKPQRPVVPISIEEFQARWQWWKTFKSASAQRRDG